MGVYKLLSFEDRRSAIAASVVIGVLLIVGGLLFGLLTPYVFPPQASEESLLIDNLFRLLLVLGGAVFLLVQGTLVYSVIRFWVRAGDTSDGPPIHGNAVLEFTWTAIPAGIVLILSLLSFGIWQQIITPAADEITVNAQGQRFAWSFSYYDPVNELTFNSPELHVWVGQNVRMELNSEDVNHAFWIPAFRLKQDLLSGRTTEVRFTPILPGTYPVVCAELCGDGHGNMRAQVVVHEDEAAYNEWAAPIIDKILNPPDDPVLLGESVLAGGEYPCSGCHSLSSLGWVGNQAPNLDGIGTRAERRGPGLTAEEYLVQSIRNPHEFLVPGYGPLMPQFQAEDPAGPNYMPDEDLTGIVAYLLTQTE